MTKKSDLFHSKNYLILNFIILFGYIFLYPLITNKLDPTKFGNYILAYTFATVMVAISNLGVREAYKRNFFEFYENKRETEILLFTVQLFFLIICCTVLSLNIFFEKNIILYFKELKHIENFWPILILAIMFEAFSKIYLIFLQNYKKSKLYFFIIFSKNIIYFLFVFYFLFNDYGLVSLIYSLFISNFILFLIVVSLQLKNRNFSFNFNYLKSILVLSLPTTPKILFGQINSKIDKIFISIFSSIANTGIYSIAQSLSYVIFQIITSLDKVFITQTNRMLFNKQNDKIGRYLSSYIYVCSIPALVLILFNDLILKIIIDEKYRGSENVIIILSIYYFTLIFSKISGTQLMYSKKVWLNTNFFILNIACNIILNIPFIYFFGIVGAALATLIAALISLTLSLYYAKKFAPISYNQKLILHIYAFIFLSSMYSIAVNEKLIDINLFKNFIISSTIVITFFIYGYLNKIYSKADLKEILKFR
jgi:O-antigen/teichoic acid export membrane protein